MSIENVTLRVKLLRISLRGMSVEQIDEKLADIEETLHALAPEKEDDDLEESWPPLHIPFSLMFFRECVVIGRQIAEEKMKEIKNGGFFPYYRSLAQQEIRTTDFDPRWYRGIAGDLLAVDPDQYPANSENRKTAKAITHTMSTFIARVATRHFKKISQEFLT